MSTDLGSNRTHESTTGGLRWRSLLSGRGLGSWWVAITLGGAIAISASSGLTAWRFVIPVGLMFLYAWYGYNHVQSLKDTPALRAARTTLLADSLYFLGFLWTLWALIDSFVLKHFSEGNSVFRVFGYALATTATGMFLRLLFLQFLYTSEDQLGLAEITIEEKLREFEEAVHKAGTAIQDLQMKTEGAATNFQIKAGSVVEAWAASLRRAVVGLEGVLAKVEAVASGIRDALRKIHESSEAELRSGVESVVKGLAVKLETLLQNLTEANREFVKAVNEGTGKIGGAIATGRDDKQNRSAGGYRHFRGQDAS